MPDTIRTLIVEDDDAARESWRRTVESFNTNANAGGWVIQASYAKSKEEVEGHVSSHKIDAAIVDLRLKVQQDGNQHNDQGNAVVEFLAQSDVAAIAVHAGQPGEARELPDLPHVKVIPKGEGLEPVIDWLRSNSASSCKFRKQSRSFTARCPHFSTPPSGRDGSSGLKRAQTIQNFAQLWLAI